MCGKLQRKRLVNWSENVQKIAEKTYDESKRKCYENCRENVWLIEEKKCRKLQRKRIVNWRGKVWKLAEKTYGKLEREYVKNCRENWIKK